MWRQNFHLHQTKIGYPPVPSLTHGSTQERARLHSTVNLEKGEEIICNSDRVTYGIPFIFQYIRVQTAKVHVCTLTVLWKFPMQDYGIGPTTKVGVPNVNWVTFFLG